MSIQTFLLWYIFGELFLYNLEESRTRLCTLQEQEKAIESRLHLCLPNSSCKCFLLMMTLQRAYSIYYVHHGGWHPQESQCKWTTLTFSLSQTASDGLVSSLRSWQCVWMQAQEWRHSLWHTSERSRSSEWDPPFNPIPKFSICWILTIKLGGVFHSLATVTDDSNRYFTIVSHWTLFRGHTFLDVPCDS